jgi:hypothetical protein
MFFTNKPPYLKSITVRISPPWEGIKGWVSSLIPLSEFFTTNLLLMFFNNKPPYLKSITVRISPPWEGIKGWVSSLIPLSEFFTNKSFVDVLHQQTTLPQINHCPHFPSMGGDKGVG